MDGSLWPRRLAVRWAPRWTSVLIVCLLAKQEAVGAATALPKKSRRAVQLNSCRGRISHLRSRCKLRGSSARHLQAEDLQLEHDGGLQPKKPKEAAKHVDDDDNTQSDTDSSISANKENDGAAEKSYDEMPTASPSGPGESSFQEATVDQSKSGEVHSSSSGMTIGISSSMSALLLTMLFVRYLRNVRVIRTERMSKGEGENSTRGMDDETGLAVASLSSDHRHGISKLTGTYKLRKSHHLNEFLEALGVSWAVRSAVCSAKPVHTILHDMVNHTVVMKFKGMPRLTYHLTGYGGTTTNSFLERTFACRSIYLVDKSGFEVLLRGVDNGNFDLRLKWQRYLNDDRETVQMVLTALFPDKDPVRCIQVYRRVGELPFCYTSGFTF
jgi:hypothetical protein